MNTLPEVTIRRLVDFNPSKSEVRGLPGETDVAFLPMEAVSEPPGDRDFPLRLRLIKTWYTKHRPGPRPLVTNQSRRSKEQQQLWQKRYWEHLIRNDRDREQHVDYIHFNPVKHGYATRVRDWRWSSIHRYVRAGMLDENWGDSGVIIPSEVGHE